MGELPLGATSFEKPFADRLDSWKEIAAYLKRDVTTVQRWEKREGMPVHRHLHDRIGSVYASRAELDAWTRTRNPFASENGNGALSSASLAVEEAAQPAEPPSPEVRREKGWFTVRVSLASRVGLAALVLLAVLASGVALWLRSTEYFWKSPIADARFQAVTDFDGVAAAATISRDGRLLAFLSDRDGPMDVWVTQVGSGEYHNLTHGSFAGLGNPAIRTLAFSPDASLVTFWLRRPGTAGSESTGTWAVPTLGGQPRPYLDGVAEFDWSRDGSELAFHTSASGDPLYVAKDGRLSDARFLFTAASGLHSHFPMWSPDGAYLYFVHGSIPDKLDIWRMPARGGTPERVTFQDAALMYPVILNGRTLLYLATDADGSGPWIYSLDLGPNQGLDMGLDLGLGISRHTPHRLTSGPERYTSLAASADSRRLAVTVASPKRTLWRLSLDDSLTMPPTPIPLSTGTGFSPRLGPEYLLYVSTAGAGEGLWKSANGAETQLWHAAPGAHLLGAPAISADGRSIAFAVRQDGRSLLNIMQADGTNPHVLSDERDLDGAPAWSPDGRFLTIAAKDHGTPHLVQVAVDGRSRAVLVPGYSLDPAWSPDGRFVLYSGPDIGTTFAVRMLPTQASAPGLTDLTLTRGARHLTFLQAGRTVVFLQGEVQHKDLWQMDLQTGVKRPLTHLPPGFNVSDFDVAPDGRTLVLERAQEHSEVMLLDLAPH